METDNDLRQWLDAELFMASLIPCADSEFNQFKDNYAQYLNQEGLTNCVATARWKAKTDLVYKRIDEG